MRMLFEKYSLFLGFFLTLAILVSPADGLSNGDVSLSVKEPAGVHRRNDVIIASVPFPKGLLENIESLSLLDLEQSPVPAQFRVLSRWWPENSVRWLQVVFQADLKAGGTLNYTLGSQNKNDGSLYNGIKVAKSSNAVTVQNDNLKVLIRKDGKGLFEKVWFDINQDGIFSQEEKILTAADGGGLFLDNVHFETDSPGISTLGEKTSVVVEESGPLRAVIKIEGRHRGGQGTNFLTYKARLFLYAGKPEMRIEHTIRNSPALGITPKRVFWDSYGVSFSLANKKGFSIETAVDKDVVKTAIGKNETVDIYQDSPGGEYWNQKLKNIERQEPYSFRGVKIQHGLKTLLTGDHSSGWVNVKTDDFGTFFGVPHFWAEAPKGFEVDGNGKVRIELWPEEFAGHSMGPDVQKTHEIFFAFHNNQNFSPQKTMLRLSNPLLALPSNDWIAQTDAWEEFGAIYLEQPVLGSFEGFVANSAKRGELGVWNFGGNVWEHGGGNFEPPTWYFQKFIESRDYDLFKIAELNARHWRDLRNYHFGVDWEELVLKNSPQTVQKFYRDRVKEKGWSRWPAMDIEHTTAKDRVLHYYLTGDRLTADGLEEESEWIKWYIGHQEYYINSLRRHKTYDEIISTNWQEKIEQRGIGWWTARTLGWQMRQLMMIYRALGDEDDLGFARYLAFNRAMKNQDLFIGIYNGESHGETKPWMEAIIGFGLAHIYATTQEEDILDSLIGLGRWLSDERLVGGGGAPYKWKFGQVHDGGPSNSSNRIPGLLAWLYKNTGHDNFLDSAVAQAKSLEWELGSSPPKGSIAFELFFAVSDPDYLRSRDRTPPAAINDLKAEHIGGNKVKLSWTAPGDDGNNGRARKYQIKYSRQEIVEDMKLDWDELKTWDGTSFISKPKTNFWAAFNLENEPKPKNAGTQEEFVISMPDAGTYFFALKSWDDGPNASPVSNVVELTLP